MTEWPRALDLEVVQQRPCLTNHSPCMSIEVSPGVSQLPSRHVCDDGRASRSKGEVGRMITEDRVKPTVENGLEVLSQRLNERSEVMRHALVIA